MAKKRNRNDVKRETRTDTLDQRLKMLTKSNTIPKVMVLKFASFIIFLAVSPFLAFAGENVYQNVYSESLSSCSSSGMAKTGWTRSGYCVDKNGDSGSHHICIDLSSTTGGNFCDVTGQSDWCSSTMSCQDDDEALCPVQHWCVCQWAFASYIENAGGCDAIQEVVCDAINIQAIMAYREQGTEEKIKNALDCLIERCGIDGSSQ